MIIPFYSLFIILLTNNYRNLVQGALDSNASPFNFYTKSNAQANNDVEKTYLRRIKRIKCMEVWETVDEITGNIIKEEFIRELTPKIVHSKYHSSKKSDKHSSTLGNKVVPTLIKFVNYGQTNKSLLSISNTHPPKEYHSSTKTAPSSTRSYVPTTKSYIPTTTVEPFTTTIHYYYQQGKSNSENIQLPDNKINLNHPQHHDNHYDIRVPLRKKSYTLHSQKKSQMLSDYKTKNYKKLPIISIRKYTTDYAGKVSSGVSQKKEYSKIPRPQLYDTYAKYTQNMYQNDNQVLNNEIVDQELLPLKSTLANDIPIRPANVQSDFEGTNSDDILQNNLGDNQDPFVAKETIFYPYQTTSLPTLIPNNHYINTTPSYVTNNLPPNSYPPAPYQTTQKIITTIPPIPKQITNSNLIATPQNCKKMIQFSSRFFVTDVQAWIRQNCAIAKMLVPQASCEDFITFVDSCYTKNLL